MLRLDRNDPLDRMIIQELNGDPVLFDQWLDAMDELAEEPECAEILEEKGLRREDVLMIFNGLERISDYIAAHAEPLAERFLSAGAEDVKALCGEILKKSKIKGKVSGRDLPLYLAAINSDRMELQDFFAGQHLIQAGCALTDRPLTENPGPSE